MKDVNQQLWRLGVPAKTQHNEVAPAQHELAVIYENASLAVDNNHLVMQTLKRVASWHDMRCLLHEKPFAGMNGSGKHNNWSMATDEGFNLLSPGETPYENAQFLLFLAAFVKGVDEYQEALRVTVASAGNDHRLGAQEAPPAIISIFLGDELEAVVESIIKGTALKTGGKRSLTIGVDVLPSIPQDNTDRNRTSPFAFTGNKFEFRMPGLMSSLAFLKGILTVRSRMLWNHLQRNWKEQRTQMRQHTG
jgi:glutamine synthetase